MCSRGAALKAVAKGRLKFLCMGIGLSIHSPRGAWALHKKSGQKSDSAVNKDFLVSF